MLVLNETLSDCADHRNGTDMFERAKGKIFRGMIIQGLSFSSVSSNVVNRFCLQVSKERFIIVSHIQ